MKEVEAVKNIPFENRKKQIKEIYDNFIKDYCSYGIDIPDEIRDEIAEYFDYRHDLSMGDEIRVFHMMEEAQIYIYAFMAIEIFPTI